MSACRRLQLCALCLVATPSAVVRAEPRDPVAAEALFREGRRTLDAGDVAAACGMFAESLRLDPAPGTLLNLANCEDRLGRVASAWEHFRRAIDVLPATDPRVRVARARVTALEPRLPRLTLTVATPLPAGATVARDGVEIGSASLGVPIPIDPGDHSIVVRAAGHREAVFPVTLAEAEARSVEIRLGDRVERRVAHATPIAGPTPPPVRRASRPWRPIGIAALGVGAAALATGAVTGILALGRASVIEDPDHCDADLRCDQEGVDAAEAGGTLATVSTIGFVAGAVAAAAGVVLILLPPAEDQPLDAARLRVGPALGSIQGVVVEGVF